MWRKRLWGFALSFQKIWLWNLCTYHFYDLFSIFVSVLNALSVCNFVLYCCCCLDEVSLENETLCLSEIGCLNKGKKINKNKTSVMVLKTFFTYCSSNKDWPFSVEWWQSTSAAPILFSTAALFTVEATSSSISCNKGHHLKTRHISDQQT